MHLELQALRKINIVVRAAHGYVESSLYFETPPENIGCIRKHDRSAKRLSSDSSYSLDPEIRNIHVFIGCIQRRERTREGAIILQYDWLLYRSQRTNLVTLFNCCIRCSRRDSTNHIIASRERSLYELCLQWAMRSPDCLVYTWIQVRVVSTPSN